MISRNLLQRLKRLEGMLQQRCEPEMKPADVELIRRLYAARHRMGQAGYKAPAPSGEPELQTEIHAPTHAERMVAILQAGRTRAHLANLERAKQDSENSGGLLPPTLPEP